MTGWVVRASNSAAGAAAALATVAATRKILGGENVHYRRNAYIWMNHSSAHASLAYVYYMCMGRKRIETRDRESQTDGAH